MIVVVSHCNVMTLWTFVDTCGVHIVDISIHSQFYKHWAFLYTVNVAFHIDTADLF